MSDERNGRAYRAISGRSPRTEPSPAPTNLDFTGSINLLYARVKSQPKLADMLGVPRRTLRRWLDGEVPGRTAKDQERRRVVEGSARGIIARDDSAAQQAVRRARLPIRREARIRGATKVTIKAVMRYSDEGGPRTIVFEVGADLDAGAAGDAVDRYLNGATAEDREEVQNEGIFAPIAYGMTDEWYREAFLDRDPEALAFDVESVTFG